MKKKIVILIFMGIIWFLPAILLYEVWGAIEGAIVWLFFGWFPALYAGAYLED